MNLDSPLYGVLTDKMLIKNNGTFSLAGSIHPKIEPEVVVRGLWGRKVRPMLALEYN